MNSWRIPNAEREALRSRRCNALLGVCDVRPSCDVCTEEHSEVSDSSCWSGAGFSAFEPLRSALAESMALWGHEERIVPRRPRGLNYSETDQSKTWAAS